MQIVQIINRKSVEVQPWTPLEVIFEWVLFMIYRTLYVMVA